MARAEIKRIRERDADGTLTCTGLQWSEQRPTYDQLLFMVGIAAGFASLAGLFWAMLVGDVTLLIIGFLVAAGSFSLALWTPQNPREIRFLADGRILTPFGIPSAEHRQALGGSHEHIVSIEGRPLTRREAAQGAEDLNLFCVVLISSGGDMVRLSTSLSEATALKVSVQLTHALTELRRELADGAHITLGEVYTKHPDRAAPLIN